MEEVVAYQGNRPNIRPSSEQNTSPRTKTRTGYLRDNEGKAGQRRRWIRRMGLDSEPAVFKCLCSLQFQIRTGLT
jgi:hypothetical protein